MLFMGDARTLHSTSVGAASNHSTAAARVSNGPTAEEAICTLASFLLERGLVSLGAGGNQQLWLSGSANAGEGPKAAHAGTAVLLTGTQAAEVLGVSPRTLSGWRSRGGGPRFLKLGSAGRTSPVRYSRAALEKYQSERERLSTSDMGTAGRKGTAK